MNFQNALVRLMNEATSSLLGWSFIIVLIGLFWALIFFSFKFSRDKLPSQIVDLFNKVQRENETLKKGGEVADLQKRIRELEQRNRELEEQIRKKA